MFGGARQEGPSVDEVLAGFIKTANLVDYAIVNPNSRLISISKDNFEKLNVVTEVPQIAPIVAEKPELILPTAKGESVRAEKPEFNLLVKNTVSDKVAKPLVINQVSVSAKPDSAVVTKEAVSETLSEKVLPKTNSEESFAALMVGTSLITFAVYGASKKRYL